MAKRGTATLPLHDGSAPRWLFDRMVDLGGAIAGVIVEEYGRDELLRRLADPYWFQALGCVLGFDWHSSGVTTTTMGALKEALDPQEHGLAVVGGKGATSRRTPDVSGGGTGPDLRMPARHVLRLSDRSERSIDQLRRAYEYQPDDYEELVSLPGIGPASLRALALIAELVHDAGGSREDPAKYAYAHGGKDGTPHPVDRERYDRSIAFMQSVLEGAELERETKQETLDRLAKLR